MSILLLVVVIFLRITFAFIHTNLFSLFKPEIERAQKILSQMAESNKEGKGAFGLVSESGASEMIDEPMVKQVSFKTFI